MVSNLVSSNRQQLTGDQAYGEEQFSESLPVHETSEDTRGPSRSGHVSQIDG
jgi:hypothetical protein